MDADGHLHILEINSLASLGQGGSYVAAAKAVGLDYARLINRLVEVASARYFGTPKPPELGRSGKKDKKEMAFAFLTQRRDQLERRLENWCGISSRTHDPAGIRMAVQKLTRVMTDIRMKPDDAFTDDRFVWTWTTPKGVEKGTLLIGHLDTPLAANISPPAFRRDPEYLYGEGIGSSRAPIVMLEFALRALRAQRRLHGMPLGILCYADEGTEARYSEKLIKAAARQATRVIVLRPGNRDGHAIAQRRGLAQYRLTVEGRPLKLGQPGRPQPLLWLSARLTELAALSSRERRIAVSADDIKTDGYPMRLPHRASALLIISYYSPEVLAEVWQAIRGIMDKKATGIRWHIELLSDRPPMRDRRAGKKLVSRIGEIAAEWDIPFGTTSSLWPSVAGLVPQKIPVICGMGPAADQLYTPQESVERISLIQRTLLLTQYLLRLAEG
ncbi:D-alanine--D-alanine ligase [Desulfonema ishimotonii]|uniref:D-alanine--D-alanine ligase n=1 Tax=Desulfonema ishimotonii TaxID=45657 RepID=A0A401FY32_9BACT|nr:D-alanine--D-alanine ligase [Desulfonema ishimotonii]